MTTPKGVIKSNSPHGLVMLILNLQKYPNPHAKTQFTHMSAPPSIIFLYNAQSVISLSAELRRRRVKFGGGERYWFSTNKHGGVARAIPNFICENRAHFKGKGGDKGKAKILVFTSA